MNTDEPVLFITIRMTARQAGTTVSALDLYSRILLGQIGEAFGWWAGRYNNAMLHTLKHDLTGFEPNASWGITGSNTPAAAKIAYDIQRVVRHRLAFDRKPEGDIFVDFDPPDLIRYDKLNPPTISGHLSESYLLSLTGGQVRVLADALESYRRCGLRDYGIIADLWLEHGHSVVRPEPWSDKRSEFVKTPAARVEEARPLIDAIKDIIEKEIDTSERPWMKPGENHRITLEMESVLVRFMTEQNLPGNHSIRGETTLPIETDEPPIRITIGRP